MIKTNLKHTLLLSFTTLFLLNCGGTSSGPDLSPDPTRKIMKNIPDELNYETIMILGHNPGCADFLEYLCGEWYRMPTAATALLTNKINVKNKNVVVMISGGNIDYKLFSRIINKNNE